MELWGVRKQERTDFPKSRRSLKDFILIPGLVRSDGKASWAPGFKRFQCGQQTGKNIWKRSLHHQPPTTPPTPPQCQTLCGSLSCSVSATGTTRPAGLPVPCECGPHWGSLFPVSAAHIEAPACHGTSDHERIQLSTNAGFTQSLRTVACILKRKRDYGGKLAEGIVTVATWGVSLCSGDTVEPR